MKEFGTDYTLSDISDEEHPREGPSETQVQRYAAFSIGPDGCIVRSPGHIVATMSSAVRHSRKDGASVGPGIDEVGVTCSTVACVEAGAGLQCAADSNQVYCRAYPFPERLY